jgi:predicted nuclease of predicted toxin-antitoxin system
MPLSLYLDDCADDDALIALLRRSGYEVNTPRLAETAGASDIEHLDYAARNRQTLLTKDPTDFLELHTDWQVAHRPHSRILLVYEEREASKNMSRRQIVAAIDSLVAADIPIENQVHVLNHWR